MKFLQITDYFFVIFYISQTMNYTISDFYNTYKENLRMICGKGGLSRRVTSVGILDYEFLPEVSGKYRHYNFDEGQLVVSTLMYARDNQNLVMDAVKELIKDRKSVV